ncbi:MAG TPA: hypothetical protein VLB76_08750 [Thermoanaerobaculia bacterium]|nr:hypothetical protein [Thermoanaerobaculia bacterium]
MNRSNRTVVVFDGAGEPYARLLADGTVQVNPDSEIAEGESEEAEEQEGDAAEREGASTTDAAPPALPIGDGALLAHAGEDHSDDASGRGRGRGRGRGGSGSGGGEGDGRETIAWTTLDRTGRFQWHDPRINYRGPGVPPQVTDRDEETKVEDWRVPIAVAGERGAILGTLTWVGEPGAGSSVPTAAVVSIAALVLLGGGAVLLVRRRRAAV